MAKATQQYRIQWKGVIAGPYSRFELEEMLQREEISLLHRVEVDGKWKSLGELFKVTPPVFHFRESKPPLLPASAATSFSKDFGEEDGQGIPNLAGDGQAYTPTTEPLAQTSPQDEPDKLILVGYILCGAAFVFSGVLCRFSPMLAILGMVPAIAMALYLHLNDEKEPARLQFVLGPVFGLLGVLFHMLIRFAEMRGWI